MKITAQEVEHVALLARLDLTEKEVQDFTMQLNGILNYMEKLGELDTADVEPTSHVIEVGNVVREDRFQPSLAPEDALANAPDPGGGFFKVPKII